MHDNFISEQKNYERVRNAIQEKEELIVEKLRYLELKPEDINILIVAYKTESILELYVKSKTERKYKKLDSYPICSRSGKIGPKREEGDFQVPEGFYFINHFNPNSNFYLSLGINYPNESDKLKSKAKKLGGDIYIHGSCVTIGCLPMTDDKIKEIYLYAIHARNNGQSKIPVYIFPFKMSEENIGKYKGLIDNNQEIINFWKNILLGYKKFEKEQTELNVNVDKIGNYVF